MANYLLVQPPWPHFGKTKQVCKYFPYAFLKLSSFYRSQGHNVAVVTADDFTDNSPQSSLFNSNKVPFVPDVIGFSTVFSYWFETLKRTIDRYAALYPHAKILIGGPHASLAPDVYRKAYPEAEVYSGYMEEAEALEPAWDLMPGNVRTQIIQFSRGCRRKCSFCYAWRQGYQTFGWDEIAPRLRFRSLISNDLNLALHKDVEEILTNLSSHTINGKPIQSVDVQGGWDVRVLAHRPDLIKLFRKAHMKNVRLAFDDDLWMAPLVTECVRMLIDAGYHRRDIRCFVLYNHDLGFETIVKKIEILARLGVGCIHSRFRPLSSLSDGYIKQKKTQDDGEYYIHKEGGWTDPKVRIIGSLASDVSRMARAGVDNLDDVRRYYGRPTLAETLRLAA